MERQHQRGLPGTPPDGVTRAGPTLRCTSSVLHRLTDLSFAATFPPKRTQTHACMHARTCTDTSTRMHTDTKTHMQARMHLDRHMFYFALSVTTKACSISMAWCPNYFLTLYNVRWRTKKSLKGVFPDNKGDEKKKIRIKENKLIVHVVGWQVRVREDGGQETLGRLTYGGKLASPFTAHPKKDATTGAPPCSRNAFRPG